MCQPRHTSATEAKRTQAKQIANGNKINDHSGNNECQQAAETITVEIKSKRYC